MKMEGLVSFHRIFSLHDASCDDVDKVDEIDAENRDSGSDFSTGDDSESSNQKSQHDRPRIAHDDSAGDIGSSEQICHGNDDCQDCEKEAAIFLARLACICEIELESKSSKDDEGNERKASCKPRDSVREIDRIKHDDIPKDSHEKREIVEGNIPIKDTETHKKIIKPSYPTKYMTNIGDLDACKSNNGSNSYLHCKTYHRGYTQRTFSNSLHIIKKANERNHYPNTHHDDESFLKKRGKISKQENKRTHDEECG